MILDIILSLDHSFDQVWRLFALFGNIVKAQFGLLAQNFGLLLVMRVSLGSHQTQHDWQNDQAVEKAENDDQEKHLNRINFVL